MSKHQATVQLRAADNDGRCGAASLQFVRKISGYQKPSKVNEEAFDRAVDEIARVAGNLLDQLVTTAPKRNRKEELALARLQRSRYTEPATKH